MTQIDPIVVEQTLSAPIDQVWSAITDRDQMRQWFFEAIEEFEPVRGFETSFIVSVEGREFPHLWKVTEVIPRRRISYDWRYGGSPGTHPSPGIS